MNALMELSRLAWQRPGPHADADTVAAWYQAKATTHAHLSAEAERHGDVLGAARERRFARQAAAHATRLRTEGVVA